MAAAGGRRRRTRWPAPRPSGTRPARCVPDRPGLTEPARTLVTAPSGGTVHGVVRREPVTAWLARSAAGQDAVYEQLDGGRPSTLYRETRPGVRLTSLALLDGGRVAVVAIAHRRTASRTASVLLVTPRPERAAGARGLGAVAASPCAYSPVLSAFGQRVAFRRRVGTERGLADQIVVLDVLRGTSRVVASARLRTRAALGSRRSGFGRVVWSAAQVAGTQLVRSRVLATPA